MWIAFLTCAYFHRFLPLPRYHRKYQLHHSLTNRIHHPLNSHRRHSGMVDLHHPLHLRLVVLFKDCLSTIFDVSQIDYIHLNLEFLVFYFPTNWQLLDLSSVKVCIVLWFSLNLLVSGLKCVQTSRPHWFEVTRMHYLSSWPWLDHHTASSYLFYFHCQFR